MHSRAHACSRIRDATSEQAISRRFEAYVDSHRHHLALGLVDWLEQRPGLLHWTGLPSLVEARNVIEWIVLAA